MSEPAVGTTRAAAPERRRALAGLLTGSLLIGLAAVFVRLADTTGATAATGRCALAVPPLVALLLLVWTRRERRARNTTGSPAQPRPDRRTVGVLAALAGIALAARLLSWNASIALVGAGLSTVLQGAQVVVVPLVAWLAWREAPTRAQLLALPPVLVGCVLLSGVVGGDAGSGAHAARGVLLGLLAAVMFAGFQLGMGAAMRRGGSDIAVLTLATGVGALGSGGWGVARDSLDVTPGWAAAGWLALLAVVVQVVGWLLIVRALRVVGATTVSLALLLQPAGAMVLGVTVLDERPSTVQWIGVAVVLAGVALAARPAPVALEAAVAPAPRGPTGQRT